MAGSLKTLARREGVAKRVQEEEVHQKRKGGLEMSSLDVEAEEDEDEQDNSSMTGGGYTSCFKNGNKK
jgi:hypothetical protein